MSHDKRQQRGRLLHPCLALKPNAALRVRHTTEAALHDAEVRGAALAACARNARYHPVTPDFDGESMAPCGAGEKRCLDRPTVPPYKRPRNEGLVGIDDCISSSASTAVMPWTASYGGRNWLERDMLARARGAPHTLSSALQGKQLAASCGSLLQQAVTRVACDGAACNRDTLDALLRFCCPSPRAVTAGAPESATDGSTRAGTMRRAAVATSLFTTWRYYAAQTLRYA